MRLMPNHNCHFSEDEMQQKVAEYFAARKFLSNDPFTKYIIPKVYREVHISGVSRISDVIIYLTDRRIINIECKLVDYNFVFNQAKDHLSWADYSYICLPADTYLPAYIIDKMINLGIGLLFWSPDYFVEVIQSGYNKSKDKQLREKVVKLLKRINQQNTGKKEVAGQIVMFDQTR
jgi:hypothetical protein